MSSPPPGHGSTSRATATSARPRTHPQTQSCPHLHRCGYFFPSQVVCHLNHLHAYDTSTRALHPYPQPSYS
ncbi:hypothetical protein M407DRAFT_22917 [Tulasnella calospora MUT 4182]|uniref:Uncharacterized protein n=1 Tax=Tulasnella calospora MUT 4182 TaxID=1051891 RepID=A0A0C3QM60_9AGAM|nr:hypothetical protein M407DRAFT_22917 [Tulasnella calospora MUT 4182]